MSKATQTGTYQLTNGMWGFRYSYTVNGKKKDFKITKDEQGNPFKTEKAALKGRERFAIKERTQRNQKPTKKRMTVSEVYSEYCEKGRCDKAYGTIRKQDSLWDNHLSQKFGKRFVDDISVSEVVDYLSKLYYQEARAYRYGESFLKCSILFSVKHIQEIIWMLTHTTPFV